LADLDVTALILALLAGYGTFLVYTSVSLGWTGLGLGPSVVGRRATRRPIALWLAQAGLEGVRPREFGVVVVVLAVCGGAITYVLFGGVLPVMIGAGFAGAMPVAVHRQRRERRLASARESWPRMVEEIRLLTGSLGRPIPVALLEVGLRGPAELRGAFKAAEREWHISTDFARTVALLKDRLADPTADAACETLLVAHAVGGTDIDRRLAALAEDRLQDLQGRKDAASKQAGVRFARRFVLLVPLGMAVAGLSIGTGRAAYQTPLGQAAVVVGLAATVVCWVWAGRLMQLPQEERVFA
jgi:tight adherence protein B